MTTMVFEASALTDATPAEAEPLDVVALTWKVAALMRIAVDAASRAEELFVPLVDEAVE